MASKTCLYNYIGLVILAFLVYKTYTVITKEGFGGLKSPYCSIFMYPDMYSPKSSCSDPFNWGFEYSTGPCPHVIEKHPKN